ncbi:hypothetical protein ACLKA6_015365 [Drosophila palustris]
MQLLRNSCNICDWIMRHGHGTRDMGHETADSLDTLSYFDRRGGCIGFPLWLWRLLCRGFAPEPPERAAAHASICSGSRKPQKPT